MATKKTTKENAENKETSLILSPRITEKASLQSTANAYTFVVRKEATKGNLLSEIKKTYKVTPLSINIVNTKGKNVFSRGKFGKKADTKKAIVFLKKGDTIALS